MNFLYFLPLALATNDYKEAVHGDQLRHQMLDQTPARTDFDRVYLRLVLLQSHERIVIQGNAENDGQMLLEN